MSHHIGQYRDEIHDALTSVPEADVLRAADALLDVHRRRGNVFVLCPPEGEDGDGYVAHELARTLGAEPFAFRLVRLEGMPRRAVAWQNDWAYEDVYAEQMRGLVGPGDLVIAVSRQGRTEGAVRALQAARRARATTIAIVGFDGGDVKPLADVCLHVPLSRTEQVGDVQAVLVHMLGVALRRAVG